MTRPSRSGQRGLPRACARIGLHLVWVSLFALASACAGSAQNTGKRATRDNAIVIVECPVGDAELWVDDRFVAHVGNLRRGISLRPGSHRIELRHDDYHSHYQELTVTARERLTVTVEMAEILP